MSFKPFLAATFALCTIVGAHAQTTTPASKPEGEAALPSQHKGAKPTGSVENRADVKAKAIQARKDGTTSQGEKSTARQDKGPLPAVGEKSRAEVRSAAAAANKAGTQPKGEESVKDQAKGGKP